MSFENRRSLAQSQNKNTDTRRGFLRSMAAAGAAMLAPRFAFGADKPKHPNRGNEVEDINDPVSFVEEFTSRLQNMLELDPQQIIERLQKHCPFSIVEVSQKLGNKMTGEAVRFVYGENGEFATFYEVEPGGFIPFEHEHRDEEEDFHLISGEFTLFLNGTPVHAKAGETVQVPRNTWHHGQNDGNEPARFFVNFAKGSDAYTGKATFQAYWMLCDMGYVDEHGKPDVEKMLRLTAESSSKTRIKGVPKQLQDVANFFVDKTSRNLLSVEPDLYSRYS